MLDYKKLFIIISHTERTQRTAQRIKQTAQTHNIECTIIFLEDIAVSNNQKKKIQNDTIIYFLTNHQRIGLYVEYFASQGYAIINQRFLQGERSKLFMQNKIATNNISVPPNELLTDHKSSIKLIEKIGLPVYVKSQEQMSTILYIKDHTNLKRTVTRLQNNIGQWYIEKAYTQDQNRLIKIYYIYGTTYANKKIKRSLNFTHNIADNLHLDTFSADIIIAPNEKYWVIDINPAPGFYAHTVARETFIKQFFQKRIKNDIFTCKNP